MTLVLLAAKPDKRRVAWKRYLAEATVTSAEPKRGAALRAYVSDELRRRGLRLERGRRSRSCWSGWARTCAA